MLTEKFFCTCGKGFEHETDAVDHVKLHCRSREERTNPLRFRDRVLQMISPSFQEFSWNK